MEIYVYNYENKKKTISVDKDFDIVLVELYAGDEVIEFYKGRELVHKVDAADLFNNKRDESQGELFDGRYVVNGPDIAKWAKYTFTPHHHETISYKRLDKFFGAEQIYQGK